MKYIFGILILLLSCNTNKMNNHIDRKTKFLTKPLIKTSRKLKLYSEQKSNSTIVENIPKNTTLEFLHEKSKTKDRIQIKDEEYNLYWLKVRTEKGNEGWLYGADEKSTVFLDFIGPEKLVNKNEIALVNDISDKELEKLLGIKGVNDVLGNFHGFYQYKIINGSKKMDGTFEFFAPNKPGTIRYFGKYENGFPKGEITALVDYYDIYSTTHIEFEGGNFNCKKYYSNYYDVVMGSDITYEEEAPENCGFEAFYENP